jgi:hypothetical protein
LDILGPGRIRLIFRMIKVFYYYYYLFYTKVIPDDEPRLTVVFTLSLSESFILNNLMNLVYTVFYCQSLGKWTMLSAFVFLFAFNYIYFNSDRVDNLIKEKPVLVNHFLSIIVTMLFFAVSFTLMILVPLYLRTILHLGCPRLLAAWAL